MDEHQKTYRAVIRGRVQGVFFRASAKEKAEELGIEGEARNERDGSVEVVFSSSTPHAYQAFVTFLHSGPQLARVGSVNVEPVDHREFDGFSIVD